jgi:hypothetical protein
MSPHPIINESPEDRLKELRKPATEIERARD